ncbi:MAG TPA: hypothetical protein VMW66_06325 [Elusimicrobiales bacterium]|nr:hypothetical protein [Elusimicrobiales bacterium]
MAVCISAGEPTSACINQELNKASSKLGKMLIKSLIYGYVDRTFLLIIPSLYPTYKISKFLYDTEISSIKIVQDTITEDLKKLRAFKWPTEADRQRALRMIYEDEKTLKRWNMEARIEARKGANWRKDWNGNGNSKHSFHPGPAYQQLKTLESRGWLGN